MKYKYLNARHRVLDTEDRRTHEVKCCRRWLPCRGFTTTCSECGADYNQSGQRLALREQWGEETGEHLADILRIP
jgi:hypothetical protein